MARAAIPDARRRRAAPRRQRGAAAVFAAVATIAGLAAVALAIDLGRLYFVQRDLQRMTNLAALDAARVAGGCLGVPDNAIEAAHSEAIASVRRNGGLASYVGASGVRVGRRLTGSDGNRYFDTIEDDKNRAVEVVLARNAPMRLFPLSGETPRVLRATAAAYSRPAATVSVGSKLAELDPALLNALLGDMLGGPLTLDAVTYRNLFGVSVPFSELVEHIGVGTTEEFLDAQLPVADLFNSLADALGEQGDSAAQAAAEALADAAADDRVVTMRDLIGVEEGFEDPARQAVLDVGALVQAAAAAANGTNLLDLTATLPPPGTPGTVRVRIIEGPRQSILTAGENAADYARNAQIAVEALLPLDLGAFGQVNLKLFLQTAEATAGVAEIHCGRRGAPHDQVEVCGRNAVLRLGIGEFDDINAAEPEPQPITLIELAPVEVLGVGVGGVRITGFAVATAGRNEDLCLPTYSGPFDADGQTQELGTPPLVAMAQGLANVADALELEIETPTGLNPLVASALTEQVQSQIDTVLRPAIAAALVAVGDDLLLGLTEAAGASIGAADVTVYRVIAEEPYLFTR